MATTRLGALNRPAQFRQVMAGPALVRHPGWSLHACAASAAGELSTGRIPVALHSVDETDCTGRLGCILPKRLARRAVTRNLARRLARDAAARAQRRLDRSVWWVLRLIAPIPRSDFPSASSQALRARLREDIDAVFSAGVATWQARQARLATGR